VLILGAVMFDGVRRARDSAALVAHTRDVIDRAQAMFSSLQDAETGERGYVITGDSAYLEPYHRGVEMLSTDAAVLRALIRDNLAQRARLDSLDPILRARLATLAAGVASRRAIGFDSAASVVRSGHGNVLLDSIRTIVGD
jgi:methyl-accepting chemotaxis protein